MLTFPLHFLIKDLLQALPNPDLALWMRYNLSWIPVSLKQTLSRNSVVIYLIWLGHAAYGVLVAQPGVRTCSGSLES